MTELVSGHSQANGQVSTIFVERISGRASLHILVAVPFKGGNLTFKFVGFPNIIGIKERNPPPSRSSNSAVARRCRAAVLRMPNGCYAVELRLRYEIGGSVGGSVVYKNNFPIRQCLGEHTLDSARQRPFAIKNRDDNTHFRRIRQFSNPLMLPNPAKPILNHRLHLYTQKSAIPPTSTRHLRKPRFVRFG